MHDEVLLDIRRKAADKRKIATTTGTKEYYGIPQGFLYRYISYPNYFCEWIEWGGFALAAAPLPTLTLAGMSVVGGRAAGMLTPPWIFFIAEVMTMLPRAYRGHQWYLKKFPEYPKNRKAVVPFVL